ncbi:ribosomal RNA small subunit methyltransferase NEP1 isoform X2 [Sipha flava]|uniref:Ribosomal RNA small subunit methyltransferase NEP1 isoform X2 n=1 Tax=Sipha flava TaxID=143950 RepID=A0A8B8GFB1_9HEMI|nr:ribosomal RNA small subunit methyltransferase NEP1 isoform X2 [Sipha flava]
MGKKRRRTDEDTEFDLTRKAKEVKDDNEKRLIVILENAQLETVKVGKTFELLNPDEHGHILRKHGRELGNCRPDITHQCLLMLFDSPLNRAGLLQVYIHTENNVLIEINPQTRIPRTFKRFAGLMAGCRKIATSFSASKPIKPTELVIQDAPIAFVIGAMAHGQIKADYAEETVAISNYPLSAALTCTKICSAFEDGWGIL